MAPRLLTLLLLLGLSPLVAAQDEDLDDIMGGFEEDDGLAEVESTSAIVERPWELTGAVTLGASYAYQQDDAPPGQSDYSGFSKLQAQLSLQLDLNLPKRWQARIAGRAFRDYAYVAEGRDRFTDAALDNHEREAEFQEVWIAGGLLTNLDLKFGRQVMSWGRSDNLRVLDVLNPIDSREPGLVNVEDLKLPVTMTRLDYYLGDWSLTGVAVHETRFDTGPVPGSDFFPDGVASPREVRPANGGSDTEWAMRLRGVFSGWDVSFIWARYFDDQSHVVPIGTLPGPMPVLIVQAEHARLSLYGVSGQFVRGNWLFKSEVGHIRGLRYADLATREVREMSRFDVMAGIEYSGINDWTFAFELVNRHLSGWDSSLLAAPNFVERNAVSGSVLITANFLHERLSATWVAVVFGAHAEDGGLYRFQLEYDVRDALSVSVGVVLYEDGDRPPLDFLGHHDRLFAQIKWSF